MTVWHAFSFLSCWCVCMYVRVFILVLCHSVQTLIFHIFSLLDKYKKTFLVTFLLLANKIVNNCAMNKIASHFCFLLHAIERCLSLWGWYAISKHMNLNILSTFSTCFCRQIFLFAFFYDFSKRSWNRLKTTVEGIA